MNNTMFSLRASHEILEKLDTLATRTQRSRASVIRWLIYEAYVNLGNPQGSLTGAQHHLDEDGNQLNPASLHGGKK